MSDTFTAVPAEVTKPAAPLVSFSERIVEAAATILDDGWYEDYTINRIVHVAKVGISTLYVRFPGKKDAITKALMRHERMNLLAWVYQEDDTRNV